MASISIRWMCAAPLFRARAHTRTWNEYGSCRITGRIWLLSDYRKFVIFPCRYEFRIRSEGKQLSSEIFELLISHILTKLHVIYWYMCTGWPRFWLYCNFSCTTLLSPQGLTIIVFTEVAIPRSRATQCLGLYLGHLVSGVISAETWSSWERAWQPLTVKRRTSRNPKDVTWGQGPVLGCCTTHHTTILLY